MINAKDEMLEHLKYNDIDLSAAYIYTDTDITAVLPLNYTDEQFAKFLNDMDFIYDNGWGGQELFGTLWHSNGSWSNRGEYDGSEWWQHITYPQMPEEVLINEKC